MPGVRPRRLVVNADDFGFTQGVNEGIIEAHRNGILTATTLMATGPAFEHAAALARRNPDLDVGCHLVLVGAPGFPDSVGALLGAVALRRIRIHEELAAQVRRIVEAGIRPTHLDSHKHTHLLPPVLNAVARIAEEFGIRWVRRPMAPLLGRVLARHGCRTTDHFTGFRLTGRFSTPDLVRLIHRLPPGTTELMTHPGRCTEELRRARTRLKESRERELAALTAPETRAAIREAGVEVVRFRDL